MPTEPTGPLWACTQCDRSGPRAHFEREGKVPSCPDCNCDEVGVCEHARAVWAPLDVTYGPDGTAEVSQEGNCLVCKQALLLTYTPGDPRT